MAESVLRTVHARMPNGWRVRASRLWLYWRGWLLLMATITGLIPSHRIRIFLYRRLFGMRIGCGSTLHWQCRFFDPEKISIGDHTLIGNNVFLDGRSGLTIGDCVITASEVAIYTLQHDMDDPLFTATGAPVVIERYAYIGPRVIILPGVRVGEGAVVGAGAVVTTNVAPYTLVAGAPAKFIRNRTKDLLYVPDFRMPFQ